MHAVKREYYLFFWLAAGVAFATVAVNRLFAAGIVSYEALYQRVAETWEAGSRGNEIRILLIRFIQAAVIFWICRSNWRSLGILTLLFTAGFSYGTALVLFTWCRGWFGLVCFLLSGFPQETFYLAAWGLMIVRYGLGVEVRSGRFWSVVLVFLLIGLFLELRLNPLIIKFL